LPDGSGVILGRDMNDNAVLKGEGANGTIVAPVNCPGPTALIPVVKSEGDLNLAAELVCAYSKCDRLEGDIVLRVGENTLSVPRPYNRDKYKAFQIC
jgi:hypothetical protein